MNLLIDTHVLIWFITEDKKLPLKTKNILKERDNDCYVSIATYWEVAIKYSLGRLTLNSDLRKFFQIVDDSGFVFLPITVNQILITAQLNYYHNDPFDRMIIAQAISENLKIVSKDKEFQKYQVPIIWEK